MGRIFPLFLAGPLVAFAMCLPFRGIRLWSRDAVYYYVAKQEGVTPAQVRVETRDEHRARIASK